MRTEHRHNPLSHKNSVGVCVCAGGREGKFKANSHVLDPNAEAVVPRVDYHLPVLMANLKDILRLLEDLHQFHTAKYFGTIISSPHCSLIHVSKGRVRLLLLYRS